MSRPDLDFVVLSTAGGAPDVAPAAAASRAGGLGVVDLAMADSPEEALRALARLVGNGDRRFGAAVDDEQVLAAVLADASSPPHSIVVPAAPAARLEQLIGSARERDVRVLATACTLPDALAAEAAGADAVVAKGHEAGGWIDGEGTFVLLQRLLAALRIPVWAHGGIGLHTAAAAHVAGAAGAVLDSQVLLARESRLPAVLRSRIASMDGSETAVLGAELGAPVRLLATPGAPAVAALRAAEARLQAEIDDAAQASHAWRAAVRDAVSDGALLIGQDAAFAADLARRFRTTGGIIAGLRTAATDGCIAAQRHKPLGEGAPLARSHATRYPIVQGPMTRVSDRAEFAAAVADAGGLPFLALALMRAPEVDSLLRQTARLVGEQPWGVGILGFVPPELRAEQLEVVHAHQPPFALIAGGRPDQARALEERGITTYLHVPSPALLELYLADGARRFVLEGRECGGHVGPRTSFVLWDTMLRVLLDHLPRAAADCHVLLAGGIHDARSAAMAAATAAPAAERGVRVGALLGTAYLFTREATEHGAITQAFQDAAVDAAATALVESGPGHATRCLPSPFVDQFAAEKRRLRDAGATAAEQREGLERLNIGRLRIAAKGVDRHPRSGEDPEAPKLTPVPPADQWERGMFMIGQVAALRDRTTTLAELHRDIAEGGTELLGDGDLPARAERPAPPPADVAIIGLGCILPGAPDIAALWSNILDKVDAVGEVPDERWDWRSYYDADPAAPDKVYSHWGGFIDEVEFDPIAFGLPPASLRSIEPFQLLALLTAQAALRDAGYATRPFDRERTSVVLGAGGGGADLAVGYTVRSAVPELLGDLPADARERLHSRLPEWTEDSFAGLLMNVAAGRIANRLDFGGANYTVDAACASSLAAVGAGVGELRAGTSDLVLAGGVDAIQNPFAYLCFSKTHALSPTGRCRPFDAAADGIAISEGFATVVLKRLADAERDGDRIYAVLRGVGAASDGRDRSLTAPRPEGQVRALRRAYAQARFSPATVELVEAHGTGTVAGDAAETQALTSLFSQESEDRAWCAIGSIKSMIGHTKATAGVAGLVKAALALHHRVLPPTIGVTEPNPKARFGESPFYVNTEARPWVRGAGAHPRRAGVSAFGFGGTDFHAVLEEYTGEDLGPPERALDRWPAELLLWRGTRDGIAAEVQALAAQLDRGARPALADLARTLAERAPAPGEGRCTLAVVAGSADDLRGRLAAALEALAGDAPRVHASSGVHWSTRPLAAEGRVAFLFPGQGSQVVDMAADIAMGFPEALASFDLADRVLADELDRPLSRYVFPPPSFNRDEARRRQEELTQTQVAQPALGAAGLAYLEVLERLGVRPDMAAGHSYGEFTALTAAGCMGAEDLLRLSAARGRAMADAAGEQAGAMAAVEATSATLEGLLPDDVVVANRNAPQQTVMSGPAERVEDAIARCGEHGIRARRLPVACAFHSPHVAGAQRRVAEALSRVPLQSPRIPVFSNTTGDAHPDDPDAIAAVLGEHLARPVEFVAEVEALHRDGARLFVEVGPRSVLSGLVDQTLGDREHLAIPVDRPGRPGLTSLLDALAALAAEGVPVRVERLLEGRRAESLDLAALDRDSGAEPSRPGLWKVHGGRARPADEPVGAAPYPSRTEEAPEMATTGTNGAAPPPATPSPMTPERVVPAPQPYEAVVPPPAAPGDGVGHVMGRYQDVMQHFIELQRSVMLAYLGARAPGSPATPPTRATAPPAAPTIVPSAVPAPSALPPAPAPAPEAPVAPVAPAPAPDAAAAPAPEITRDEIRDRLLAVVSERTGYPAEMLGLDADLEGDLGIDSIKRVEIAGTLAQTLPAAANADIEQITAARTLDEVINALAATIDSSTGDPAETRPFEPEPADEERIGRFVVHAVSAPTTAPERFPEGPGTIVLVDDDAGVGVALEKRLTARGQAVERVARDGAAAERLAERLRREGRPAKALIHLPAPSDAQPARDLAVLLLHCQALQADLEAAAGTGGAVVLGACRLDGAFGALDGVADGAAPQGAIAGFLKSLAHEWPAVRVRAVDVGPAAPAEAAERLAAELAATDGCVEVGHRDGVRRTLALSPAPLDERSGEEPLDASAVVLVIGGARGITAQAALAVAERHRPTLVIVGRTDVASEEDGTAGLEDLPSLRRWFTDARRRAGAELTPALVEADCRTVLRHREARGNLARLRATGAQVEYLTCDVADPDALGELVARVYADHGRIDGVIHGAGLVEDRLVRDKAVDSLERVLATKAGAGLTLARHLRPDGLRFMVFFSSVAGRFGNRGQADYAAASEILDKLARELDRRWDARVVAVEWGPWRAGGMVSPEVQRQFAARGVALVPPDMGCRMLLDELRLGAKGEPEVVVAAAAGTGLGDPTAATPSAALPLLAGTEPARTTSGGLEIFRTLDVHRDRFLDDHRVDGQAVLPFAVAMELMAEAATAARPGATVAGLREIRVLNGVTVADAGTTVRIATEPPSARDDVETVIAGADGGRPHYRAVVELRDRREAEPGAAPWPEDLADLRPFPMAVTDAYSDLLFHGPRFQRIQAINGLDDRGASALLLPSDAGDCVAGADGLEWLLDPVLLDCALQVQVLWARLNWDVTLLPAGIGSHRRLAPLRPDGANVAPIRLEMRVRPGSRPPLCHADHWFRRADGTVVATLGEVVGVGSRSLNRLAAGAA